MLGVDTDAAATVGCFEAVYVAGDGAEHQVSLAALAGAQLEGGRPVRSFPSYRGQRNYRAGTGRRRWAGGSGSNRGSSVITW